MSVAWPSLLSTLAIALGALVGCVPAIVDMPFGLEDQAFLGRFYDPKNVPTLEFEVSDTDMDVLEGDSGYGAAKEYVPAALTYVDTDGSTETLDGVGLRLKGSGSFKPMSGKAAFKVDMDHYAKKQRFHGLEHLTLNNMTLDPTMMAEVLAYPLYRDAGVAASRCNFVKVYVNGTYYGLHANVETVDELMLMNWFPDGSGNLYESELGGDLSTDTAYDDTGYYPGTPDGFTQDQGDDNSDLLEVSKLVSTAPDDEWYDDVSERIDMPEFLRYLALNQVTTNPDGYGTGHNFYVYHDPDSGKFTFLPWSLDLSFYDYYGTGVKLDKLPGELGSRCRKDDRCRDDLLDAALDVADVMEQDLPDAFDNTRSIVDANFDDETHAPYDRASWESSTATLQGIVDGRPDEIRDLVDQLR